jgi:tRNA(fMet)-specific endonuclease VapC
MIGNKCVIDTSIVIAMFKNNEAVVAVLDKMHEIYVPVTVVGELRYGAYKAADTQKHLSQVNTFLSHCTVLPSDLTTADVYGSIKTALSKKGKPIPENDIWIAAIAVQHNLPLYANDAHFNEIDTLTLM